jgi:hypothetical protein
MRWSLYFRTSARHPLDRTLAASQSASVRCNDERNLSLLDIELRSLSHPACGLITILTELLNNETRVDIIFTRFLLMYTYTFLDGVWGVGGGAGGILVTSVWSLFMHKATHASTVLRANPANPDSHSTFYECWQVGNVNNHDQERKMAEWTKRTIKKETPIRPG